ncbi:MAG: 4'-phosphopantetheinyl transferase superfamily protein [Lachnospiraceae bacterium]|nr:4'-phosphopantetheinyl transferase superfamily protein [Lachnospiraceae bacterium]
MVIYLMDITIPDIESLSHRVSEERLEQIGKFRFETDKRRGLAAEALLNHGLNRLCPGLKTPVSLTRDENGKPHVILTEDEKMLCVNYGLLQEKEGEIAFSLSHAGNYAVCAIADSGESAVGVDIERHERNPGNIAEHFFCRNEVERIENSKDFYTYWTLKESFIKAIGLGLKLPLDSFEVIISDGGLAEYKQDADRENRYFGRVYGWPEGYTVSACAPGRKDCFPEKIEEVPPDALEKITMTESLPL